MTQAALTYTGTAQLKDGRVMHMRLATCADIDRIVSMDILPENATLPERLCRVYMRHKSWIYVTAPGAGIVTGWVDGDLVGFMYFYASRQAVRRTAKSAASLWWLAKQWLTGKLGFNPANWIAYARWMMSRHGDAHESGQSGEVELPDRCGLTTHLYVPDKYRRLGIGNALTDAAEECLRRAGAEWVAGFVRVTNQVSANLHRKRGYTFVRRVGTGDGASWLIMKRLVEDDDGS